MKIFTCISCIGSKKCFPLLSPFYPDILKYIFIPYAPRNIFLQREKKRRNEERKEEVMEGEKKERKRKEGRKAAKKREKQGQTYFKPISIMTNILTSDFDTIAMNTILFVIHL
jgi:hypothetical protein